MKTDNRPPIETYIAAGRAEFEKQALPPEAKGHDTAAITIPSYGYILGDDDLDLGYSMEHGFLIQQLLPHENIDGKWTRISEQRADSLSEESEVCYLDVAMPISIDEALRLIPRFFNNAGGFHSLLHAVLDRAGVARA